jgi:hypothetical protein
MIYMNVLKYFFSKFANVIQICARFLHATPTHKTLKFITTIVAQNPVWKNRDISSNKLPWYRVENQLRVGDPEAGFSTPEVITFNSCYFCCVRFLLKTISLA